MSIWRQVTRGLRVLFRRDAADREVADEARHYMEEAAAAHMERGLSPEEARRAARRELGSLSSIREEVRSAGWENTVATLMADIRHGVRRLRSRRGFALAASLTLAVGIGASTAVFSVARPILFASLPYPDAGQLVSISDVLGGERIDVAFGTYRELAERTRSFEGMAAMKPWQPTLVGQAEPERLDGQRTSATYFDVLGVPVALGRGFTASDDRPGAPRVVILSDALWRRRFAADAAIVGREILLDGDGHAVIGVMPPAFENLVFPSAAVWAPLQYDPSLPAEGREWGHHLRVVARLRSGVAAEQARRELATIAADPVPEFARVSWASLRHGLLLQSLQLDVTAGVRPALLAVLGAVLLLLAMACVNVTNLVLAQGAGRRGEFAVRVALGAGRVRLFRQLVTESLLLAGLGGALGLLVAELGVRALVALGPAGLPRLGEMQVDGAALAFATGVSAVVGIAVGIIPAVHASRVDPRAGLQHGSGRIAGGHLWTRRTLVIAEVALALVLLVSAGLLLRSMQRLFAVAPGFDRSGLLTMQVQVSGSRFDEVGPTRHFFAQALEAVRELPGVAAAAFTSQLPLSGDVNQYGVRAEVEAREQEDRSAFRYAVTPGYFEAPDIPLRRGRLLDERDAAGAPPAAVLSQSLARRAFGRRDPLGQRVQIGSNDMAWYTVVGVVEDVKQVSLAASRSEAVYVTAAQWPFPDRVMSLVVRARGDAAALAASARAAIWSIDKNQAIGRVAAMDELHARSAGERRFALLLFQAFGLAALLLAATGIHGVLSGSVSERMRELGLRLALGAPPRDILLLVIRQGMTLTLFGLALGLSAAVAASHAIAALLFGVSPLDPVTYVGVSALLACVSLIACWLPAARAARLDPTITLRTE